MAKSKKKSEASTSNAGAKSKKADGNKKPATPAPGGPQVDTSAAAQAAARMVSAKGTGMGGAPTGDQPHKSETSLFKQMKENLAKPHVSGVDNFLNSTGAPNARKSSLPFAAQKQVGRNQTFGADVNRTGVPRRTGGG
jgi:hypothetical protein